MTGWCRISTPELVRDVPQLGDGIGTILQARRIVLVATGAKKAACVAPSILTLNATPAFAKNGSKDKLPKEPKEPKKP